MKEKYHIQIVKLGTQRYDYVFDKLAKYKSDLFDVTIFEKADLPDTDTGWAYSTSKIAELLVPCFEDKKYDICIGYLDYQMHSKTFLNCYGSNIKDNKVFATTFYQVAEFLAVDNIELLNYVLVNIYRYLTRSIIKERIVHNETRGCINDMCGIKTDIKYSCKRPILCSSCETKLRAKTFPNNYINTLKRELKHIKKSTYYRITDFIKRHPILSLSIGIGSSLVLSVLSNIIYSLIF